ncbi:hypothetical protein [Grimontia marina]|uniref:Uncharacterized protein n=1 Tax=Grimontia marina TaxID=646534 RepID=A0A128FFU6_9GAMM|nr:hypothetical protein [Grimontia marina]CZF85663.1 hypothetical protein GMA8713_03701 [Grimontia marina]
MKNKLLSIACFSIAFLATSIVNAKDGYEVWASDQSNSISDAAGVGVKGSYLWIWDSKDIEAQLSGYGDAKPIGCGKNNNGQSVNNAGPCDLLDIFPQDLMEFNAFGNPTGNRLSDLNGFGRLHGVIADPQNRYVTANIFAPSGGYVGIIDTRTKGAVALFRVTGTNDGGNVGTRSVHMSFWDASGSAIIIANLNGKVLERINIIRNESGKIKQALFNRSASLGVGKSMSVTVPATYFSGKNQQGNKLIGGIVGDYSEADFGDLTPNGYCKENGCLSGFDGTFGGRPNNVIICPITSKNNNLYITLGGGGLLIAKANTTPMMIVGEYGNEAVNGAGCGGVGVGTDMWINGGVSASNAGATQSTFSMYTIDDTEFSASANSENTPMPTEVFKDPTNTKTNGNVNGINLVNQTGQLPDVTTRRDAHGAVATTDGNYVHNVDRIQNVVEVFNATTFERTTYDLTSYDGQGSGIGPCAAKSVDDDEGLPINDPTPDLLDATPDGKYLMVALRGPRPVSVGHSAQGSCPGVGIIEVLNDGESGRLLGVLRSTNTVDNSMAPAPGGYPYSGREHSDVHGAIVVRK